MENTIACVRSGIVLSLLAGCGSKSKTSGGTTATTGTKQLVAEIGPNPGPLTPL